MKIMMVVSTIPVLFKISEYKTLMVLDVPRGPSCNTKINFLGIKATLNHAPCALYCYMKLKAGGYCKYDTCICRD